MLLLGSDGMFLCTFIFFFTKIFVVYLKRECKVLPFKGYVQKTMVPVVSNVELTNEKCKNRKRADSGPWDCRCFLIVSCLRRKGSEDGLRGKIPLDESSLFWFSSLELLSISTTDHPTDCNPVKNST
jgi:hypothetical protein